MQEEDEAAGCEAGFHTLVEIGDVFHKLHNNVNVLDWMLGTYLNKTISYQTVYCSACGLTLEIIVSNLNPVNNTSSIVYDMCDN
jgi:hypothetical protein